jgi:hypothetical protein
VIGSRRGGNDIFNTGSSTYLQCDLRNYILIGFKPVYLSLISASKHTRWIQPPPGFLKPFSSALWGLLALTANLLSGACYVFLHTLSVILYLFHGPVFICVNPKCTLSRLSIALHSRQPTHSHHTFTLPAIPPFSNFLIYTFSYFSIFLSTCSLLWYPVSAPIHFLWALPLISGQGRDTPKPSPSKQAS